jgi:ketosteroid isomerase-like protein
MPMPFVLWLVLAGAAPESAGGRAEREVRDAVIACNRAYAANDLPAYWAFYAPELSQWFATGRVDLPTYRRDWEKFVADGGRVEAAEVEDLVVQVGPSADAAVASYRLRVRTRGTDGKLTSEVMHESDVLFRRDGRWLIVHLNYAPSEEKQPSS